MYAVHAVDWRSQFSEMHLRLEIDVHDKRLHVGM